MNTPDASSSLRVPDASKLLFVINGYPGSGKTTFGNLVRQELGRHHINFLHTSSIDPIKYILMPRDQWNPDIFPPELWDTLERCKREITDQDWDGVTKDAYWRGVMSKLKAALLQNTPLLVQDYIFAQVAAIVAPAVVFVDIREPENIQSLKDFASIHHPDLPVQAVLVESDVIDTNFDNASDAGVKNYDYDITISNSRDGDTAPMEQLTQEVRSFYQHHIAHRLGMSLLQTTEKSL